MAQPCDPSGMTPAKRLCDIALALAAATLLMLPLALLIVVLAVTQGRPIFYRSERMRAPGDPFWLWKLRTMEGTVTDTGVCGGDKVARITPIGHVLRRTRLDESPQLWNILCGDMSFVGPRPPLRAYVDRFPALYARVLQNRPGLTGLATLHIHRYEARLLAACATPQETDAVYARRCIPRKARLDLIYQRRRSLRMDLALLSASVLRVVGLPPKPRKHP